MSVSMKFHAEVKINGVWNHYTTKKINNELGLYQALDVDMELDSIEVIIPQSKGLPNDLCQLTLFDKNLYERYCFGHSWMNSDEIALLYKWIDSESKEKEDGEYASCYGRIGAYYFGYLFGYDWSSFLANDIDIDGIEDVRFIYWFER